MRIYQQLQSHLNDDGDSNGQIVAATATAAVRTTIYKRFYLQLRM